MERDEEIELDLEAGAKHLTGVETPKKKSRAKSRTKKSKDTVSKSAQKSGKQLPLSMLPPNQEDLDAYNHKCDMLKSEITKAPAYKVQMTYKTGDIFKHKTFGIGFVVLECGKQKVEVLFKTGRKLIAMGLKA